MDTGAVKMDFPKDILLAADISEANAPSDIKNIFHIVRAKRDQAKVFSEEE